MIAHFDLHAGAAGDMILGAMIDAGARLDSITKQLEKIDLPAFELDVQTVLRAGIRATQVSIVSTEKGSFPNHAAIARLVERAGLDADVRARALSVFERLARAEDRVHGSEEGDAHFHELDGLDTIVDVVGVATAFRELGVDRATASAVATGTGTTPTSHGSLPIPPPAVLELMRGALLYSGDVSAELLTPTGASILSEYIESYGSMQPMSVRSIGYGAGTADLHMPNVVRVTIGDPGSGETAEETALVECNIDDMNPEIYEYVFEKLFAAGADDVWLTPSIGKRGRPSNVLSVLCELPSERGVIDVILSETSTIGLRTSRASKIALQRDWIDVEVQGQKIRVKIAKRNDRVLNVAPEYSDCARAAEVTGLPVKEVFRRASAAAGGRERS